MNLEYITKKLKEWNPWWNIDFFNNKHKSILVVIYHKQLNETKEEAFSRYCKAKEKYPEWHNEIDCAFYDRFINPAS